MYHLRALRHERNLICLVDKSGFFHGDPIYNPDSLTPLGKKQAQALAKRLALYGIDRVFTSTSNRAIETAIPLCEWLGIESVALDFCN